MHPVLVNLRIRAQFMRTIFFTIFLTSSLTSVANKIDDLKTESGIARFVDTLSGFTTVFPKSVPPDLLHIKYLKIDLDKNGTTDLLVNDRMIFAIVDIGNDKFELKYAGKEFRQNRLVNLDTTGSAPILIVKKQNGYNRLEPTFSEVADSITYRFNGFIEYNSKPQQITIESIKISMGRCFGTCPVYDLVIYSDRMAELNAKQFMKRSGMRKTKIDEKSYKELIALISYLNPDSLKTDYSITATDNPAADLEIKYNGRYKAVHDYGLEGTLGLEQLYSLIEKLLESQKWKAVSIYRRI